MRVCFFRLLACLAVIALTSCTKRVEQPEVPLPGGGVPNFGIGETAPFCSIESRREFGLQDGTQLQVWNLKMSGLKSLTSRLLIATDGKMQTANEVEYKWEKWEQSSPAATGQLVLLIQDGKPFGVKEKRLPLLALDLQNSPSNSRIGKQQGLFVEGDLLNSMSSSSEAGSLMRKSIIFAQLFMPRSTTTMSISLGSDLESVMIASKGGRTVVAVEVEWAPRD